MNLFQRKSKSEEKLLAPLLDSYHMSEDIQNEEGENDNVISSSENITITQSRDQNSSVSSASTSATIFKKSKDSILSLYKSDKKTVEKIQSDRITFAPKIMLETLTARTTLIIIIATYAAFIIGFALDFVSIYESFNSSNHQLGSRFCKNQTALEPIFDEISYYTPQYSLNDHVITSKFSCSYNATRWQSLITDVDNVISIKLSVHQSNLTLLFPSDEPVDSTLYVPYNLQIWACFNKNGCKNNFYNNDIPDYSSGSRLLNSHNDNLWYNVIKLENQVAKVKSNSFNDANESHKETAELDYRLLPNTFQNQESIPTKGLIRSYYILIDYGSQDSDSSYSPLFSPFSEEVSKYINYNFEIVTRPSEPVTDVLTIILFFLTLLVIFYYFKIIKKYKKKLLPEQKWIVYYLISVLLFQNPIYFIVVWLTSAPSPTTAYFAYTFSIVAQVGLFIIWLLFSDSLHRKIKNTLYFYFPKALLPLLIFIFYQILLSDQFPSVSHSSFSSKNSATSVEAVYNWSEGKKVSFITITIFYIVFFALWAIFWFVRLYLTGRKLNRLPYIMTRYLQLSFRFFTIQAVLVIIYFIFQYVSVVYFMTSKVQKNDKYSGLTSITDNINTILRQQFQLFGKTFFLTIYSFLLAFLFLPADYFTDKNNQELKSLFSASYTITERENLLMTLERKSSIRKLNKKFIHQMMRTNELAQVKPNVFCVDIAIELRNLSFQSYYDPPDLDTFSGYGKLSLDSLGYELLGYIYDASFESYCIIVRKRTGKRQIVVSFRGTACKRQMEINLMYAKKKVVFDELPMDKVNPIPTPELFNPPTRRLSRSFSDIPQSSSSSNILNTTKRIVKGLVRRDSYKEKELSKESLENNETQIDEFDLECISDDEFFDDIDMEYLNTQFQREDDRVKRTESSSNLGTENMFDRANRAINSTYNMTTRNINNMIEMTTEFVMNAASHTPYLQSYVNVYCHTGFWDSYEVIRQELHNILRKTLLESPGPVYFTGHSLGGALATFASLDLSINSFPQINEYHRIKAREHLKRMCFEHNITYDSTKDLLSHQDAKDLSIRYESNHYTYNSILKSSDIRMTNFGSSNTKSNISTFQKNKPYFGKKIKAIMYNYGSPRLGNYRFAQLYDKIVPHSFRIVVDGDIVVGLPPSGYRHIGTEIIIDSLGSGSIIIDPSFVERWLRTQKKTSLSAHSLLVYRKGLFGLKLGDEYLKRFKDQLTIDNDEDSLRLVIQSRSNFKVEKIVNIRYDDICEAEKVYAMGKVPEKPVATESKSISTRNTHLSLSLTSDDYNSTESHPKVINSEDIEVNLTEVKYHKNSESDLRQSEDFVNTGVSLKPIKSNNSVYDNLENRESETEPANESEDHLFSRFTLSLSNILQKKHKQSTDHSFFKKTNPNAHLLTAINSVDPAFPELPVDINSNSEIPSEYSSHMEDESTNREHFNKDINNIRDFYKQVHDNSNSTNIFNRFLNVLPFNTENTSQPSNLPTSPKSKTKKDFINYENLESGIKNSPNKNHEDISSRFENSKTNNINKDSPINNISEDTIETIPIENSVEENLEANIKPNGQEPANEVNIDKSTQ